MNCGSFPLYNAPRACHCVTSLACITHKIFPFMFACSHVRIQTHAHKHACMRAQVEENISQMLDDHIVMSQSMSFSQFKKPFEERISKWEMQLSLVRCLFNHQNIIISMCIFDCWVWTSVSPCPPRSKFRLRSASASGKCSCPWYVLKCFNSRLG